MPQLRELVIYIIAMQGCFIVHFLYISRFAFAFFATEKAAKAAHDKLQGVVMGGRTVTVMFAKKSKHKPEYNPQQTVKRKAPQEKKKG